MTRSQSEYKLYAWGSDAKSLKNISKLNLRLLAIIMLPIIVAAASMMWSMTHMLDAIATNVNKQEDIRSWQAANSAIYSVQKKLEGIVTDNAHWDDVVPNIYDQINYKWIYDTWGAATSDTNYDASFIVDANGQDIAAYRKGVKLNSSAQNYFGAQLQKFLAAMPHDSTTFRVVGSLVQTKAGLAMAAAAPILPYSEGLTIPAEKPRYFFIVRDLDDSLVSELGGAFILSNLKISSLESVKNDGRTLSDRWGNPVAKISWVPSNPGKAARDSSYYAAILSLLALLAVMGPLALVHLSTLKKMATDEKEAYQSARKDNLSGLPNRLHLIEETNKKLPFADAHANELALAFIDLDGFKAVNDAYGHDIGDALIRVVAEGLQFIAKDTAIVARLGGDEFAFFVSGIGAGEKAQALADHVLKFVHEPFDILGRIVSIGASIGIACCIKPNLELSEFMRQADIAMYDAKENGRNRWRKFNAELDVERSEDLSIVSELRQILDHDQLEVAYQPFVSSRDRQILGVEALARWPQSSLRSLGPDRFIPIAEQHGLIDKLGMVVFRKACRDMSNWRDLKVAVNFSPLQIKRVSFISDIQAVAAEFNFDLKRLEVEFTESVLIQNPDRAKIVISQLQALGITVALDDFGTGYASVGYLHRFAFDKIKLDRSLTQSLSRGGMIQNIVQGTVLIAKGLSADVIAEGVETEEDANLMRLAGCELLQGYYFGKPQSVTVLNNVLQGHPTKPKTVSA